MYEPYIVINWGNCKLLSELEQNEWQFKAITFVPGPDRDYYGIHFSALVDILCRLRHDHQTVIVCEDDHEAYILEWLPKVDHYRAVATRAAQKQITAEAWCETPLAALIECRRTRQKQVQEAGYDPEKAL